MTLIEVLTAAQEKRQAALDLIIANPGILSPDIAKRLGWERNGSSQRLFAMAADGEISGVTVVRREKGRKADAIAYTALVEKTKQAVDVFATLSRMRIAQGRKSRAKQIEQPVSKNHNVWINGGYRNNPNNRAAISAQGGQGSYAPRMATYLETMQ